jgi:hypothetical protein
LKAHFLAGQFNSVFFAPLSKGAFLCFLLEIEAFLEESGREYNITRFGSVNSVAEKMRGEDIRESTIEEVCRANQNRLIDEPDVDLTHL